MASSLASELPNDVLVEILLRLPVKSLIRFKCVQKSWLSLIESPSFITKHYRQAISRSDTRSLLVMRELKESGTNLVTLYPSDAAGGNLTNINMPPLYQSQCRPYVHPVCANGIICMAIPFANKSIVLWNPAIRDYRVVPENPVSTPAGLHAFLACLGFAYDTKTDDYKVIRFTGFWDEYETSHAYLVDIYSLKTNLWRRVDANIKDDFSYRSCAHMFLNQIYHWLVIDDNSDVQAYYFIMGFDLSEEVFYKIELPSSLNHIDTMNTWFTVLNNSFALIIHSPVNNDEHEQSFEIWVMNEYGVKESWEKKFTIGPISGLSFDSHIGFSNNKKFLLRTQNGDILQYDLETEKIDILNVNGVPDSIQVLNYVESLVSTWNNQGFFDGVSRYGDAGLWGAPGGSRVGSDPVGQNPTSTSGPGENDGLSTEGYGAAGGTQTSGNVDG